MVLLWDSRIGAPKTARESSSENSCSGVNAPSYSQSCGFAPAGREGGSHVEGLVSARVVAGVRPGIDGSLGDPQSTVVVGERGSVSRWEMPFSRQMRLKRASAGTGMV
jgi:hypothetical protein